MATDKEQLLACSPSLELGEFIIANQTLLSVGNHDEMNRLLTSIKLAAKVVNRELRKAGLAGVLGEYGTENVQGEQQKKLDVIANDMFVQALTNRQVVCGICSEEEENFIPVNNDSQFVLLMDPLDGSSNIDVNVSVGTIFTIYKRISPVGTKVQLHDFLQAGKYQIAAGYVLYGSSTMLVLAFENTVQGFTLDQSLGTFYLSHPFVKFPSTALAYSVNEGNFNSFDHPTKQFIKFCKNQAGCTLLYIGSLVSDFHRNLLQGGVYIYPSTVKDMKGKLRLLYECNPIAFMAEQADGAASDGYNRILDIVPQSLHQRTPFCVGNKSLVAKYEEFMKNK